MIGFIFIVLIGTMILSAIEYVLIIAWLAFLESWRKGEKK